MAAARGFDNLFEKPPSTSLETKTRSAAELREISDHLLMLAVRDGNLDKLGLLFEKYHRQLYNFFRKQVADPLLCEDFVQEVYRASNARSE